MENKQENLLLRTVTGLNAGTGDFGISPGYGELCMILRSDAEPKMKALEGSILKCAENFTEKEGLYIDYVVTDYFPETRNHPECVENVKRAARQAGTPVMKMDFSWRHSEDFGDYLKESPGAMLYLGNGTDYPAVHTSVYDFNYRILETAVDICCMMLCVVSGAASINAIRGFIYLLRILQP